MKRDRHHFKAIAPCAAIDEPYRFARGVGRADLARQTVCPWPTDKNQMSILGHCPDDLGSSCKRRGDRCCVDGTRHARLADALPCVQPPGGDDPLSCLRPRAWGLLLAVAMAPPLPALAGVLGVIGDSISVAADADDVCDDAFECLENLGDDTDYSFSAGVQPWSLGPRLGATGLVSAAASGARWDDALGQAQTLVARPGMTDVVIALGANDVCRVQSASEDRYPLISRQVENTLSLLTSRLPPDGTITLVEAPKVSRLREVGATLPNFAFESCQALWNVDTAALKKEAVREVCDGVFGSTICSSDTLIDVTTDLIISRINGLDSFCGPILDSTASPALRATAERLNRQVNNILHEAVLRFRGRNGVKVLIADVFEHWEFPGSIVSYLDCFHPNRSGQAQIANVVWKRRAAPSRRPQGVGVFDGSIHLIPARSASSRQLFIPPGGTGGTGGAISMSGDWDGDGYAGVGLYFDAEGRFELYEGDDTGVASIPRTFRYGPLGRGWLPVSGDWNGDGRDGIGLYDPVRGVFHLRDRARAGPADRSFRYGPKRARLRPMVGDWNADGRDGIGVYDPALARFWLKEAAGPGVADRAFRYGPVSPTLRAFAGDWRGDGRDGIGLYDTARRLFLLRDTATPGVAERTFSVPGAGPDGVPLAGRWGSS